MEPISLTDLFFIVTGIAVIFITAFVVVALIYFILFLQSLKRIADQAGRATKFVVDDLGELGKKFKRDGFQLGAFLRFLFGLKNKPRKKN